MANPGITNRPQKFGHENRRELITEDSEVSLVATNDENGSPIWYGRAKAGTALSEERWQIRKLTYDSNGGITRVEWPQDSLSNASTNYEFAWSGVSDLTISGISQANPAAVTVSSIGSLANGDIIVITGVTGMTEVNFDGSNYYTVANIAGATFELSGINSTAYTAYVSGGSVDYGDYLQYTYS